MDTKMIDTFFDTLKEMRGIAELDKHLLHALFRMQPDISESAQKFLCLCFSLWDDGNTRILLDADEFLKRWTRKWNGLLLLKEASGNATASTANIGDFEQIVSTGVEEILHNCASKFTRIISTLETSEVSEGAISTPLILTRVAGELPYLYLDRLFRAKILIEKYAGSLFKDGSDKLPSEADIESIQEKIAGIAMYKKGGQVFPLELNAEQAQAVIRGQRENLIITGGPGTGKTTVVLYILWSLLTQDDLKTPNDETCCCSIYLAAPSGKAADRMQESLQNGLKGIRDEFKYEAGSGNTAEKKESRVYKKLKDLEGSTIHRLLKYSRSNNGFSYNAKEQFSEKSIFVIDEASMIDINLFASLLQAIPEGAKIFILGDPYQLPSVDAGAVLGEILKPRSKKDFTVRLIKSNRFTDDSVIGNLAKEIKACAEDKNIAAPVHRFSLHPALDSTVAPDAPAKDSGTEVPAQSENLPKDAVFYYSLPAGTQTKKQETDTLEKILKTWIGGFYELPKMALEIDPENPDKDKCEAIWELSLKKRILSAERRGIYGVEQINKSACKLIRDYGAKKFTDRYFPGELLMITQNQAMYKLYNGDTGIVVYKDSTPYIMLKKASENETGFVFYPLSWFPTDAVEPAFAITIHKSQGSEYDHVTMFLPKQEGHPLLNNQILYTGITRAKKTVTIIATEETFNAACETVIERDTGIEL